MKLKQAYTLAEECPRDFENWEASYKPVNTNIDARSRVASAQKEQRTRGGSYWNGGSNKQTFLDFLRQRKGEEFKTAYEKALNAAKIDENSSEYKTKTQMDVAIQQGNDDIAKQERDKKQFQNHTFGTAGNSADYSNRNSTKEKFDNEKTKARIAGAK